MIEKIKVWKKNWNGKDGYKIETRIYIDLDNGKRGGFFLTGNPYQNAGDIDGQITQADIDEALELCGGEWHTMYREECEAAYKSQPQDNHDFFSAFFDTPETPVCFECGTTENLVCINNDSGMYLCQKCRSKIQQHTICSLASDPTEEAARNQ